MSSGLPPTLAELIALVEGEPARSHASDAELALGDATGLALADLPSRTAQTWRMCAPELVRLIVINAARRTVGNPRGVCLTPRERTLIRRAHTHPPPLDPGP